MKVIEDSFLEKNWSVSYCRETVSEIIENVKRAESFSFVGVKDSNKSNLLRFLTLRKDVQKRYLGKEVDNYQFVYVDLDELVTVLPVYFYQLILVSLTESLQNENIPLKGLNNIFIDNPILFFKSLKEDLSIITKKTNKVFVFVFNNYDKVRDLQLEDSLVALRKVARYRIVYLFSLTRPISRDTYFYRKIVWRQMLTGNDCLGMTLRNLHRYGFNLTKTQIEKAILLSGGHPGLMKFITQIIPDLKKMSIQKWLDYLLNAKDILFQCERILSSLTPVERAKLKIGEKDEILINMGLQVEKGSVVRIFSPIIEKYLNSNSGLIPTFYFDNKNGEIYFLGKPINFLLTIKERVLLLFLISNSERICSREEIIKNVWGEEEFPTDWAFDQLVSRLRKKLNKNTQKTNYLRTIRKVGLILQ